VLAKLEADKPVTLVTTGDSITRGARPGVAAVETLAALLRAELRKQEVEAEGVIAGAGGERTNWARKRLDQAVRTLKPRFVLVLQRKTAPTPGGGKMRPRRTTTKSSRTG
jgi:hypothetical protein